jgi:hypothetical protein
MSNAFDTGHGYRTRKRGSFKSDKPVEPMPTPSELAEAAHEILSLGRQAAAKKHHPDAGGSNAKMSAINRAHDWLKKEVETKLK